MFIEKEKRRIEVGHGTWTVTAIVEFLSRMEGTFECFESIKALKPSLFLFNFSFFVFKKRNQVNSRVLYVYGKRKDQRRVEEWRMKIEEWVEA